jgi:hypothetical protein
MPMSIETWYFADKASRDELHEFLRALGFREMKMCLVFQGPPGTTHYHWFEEKDFKSTSGVDASLFPLDNAGKHVWKTESDWAIRTRTSIWSNSFDKEFQNHVMRTARKLFGGYFRNDHYGRNRYNRIERQPSTPAGRGIFAVYQSVIHSLDKLEAAIPDEICKGLVTPQGVITEENDENGFFEVVWKSDPSRVLYNALVPFIVASIEHFFSRVFQIMLKYDEKARQKLRESNRKLGISEAIGIVEGNHSVESLVANWYSFQNINSIHKAFQDYFGLDLWKVIRRRKKIQGKLPLLSDALDDMIKLRHGVVHHFSIDLDVDRERIIELIATSKAIIRMFVDEIEAECGIRIAAG